MVHDDGWKLVGDIENGTRALGFVDNCMQREVSSHQPIHVCGMVLTRGAFRASYVRNGLKKELINLVVEGFSLSEFCKALHLKIITFWMKIDRHVDWDSKRRCIRNL